MIVEPVARVTTGVGPNRESLVPRYNLGLVANTVVTEVGRTFNKLVLSFCLAVDE